MASVAHTISKADLMKGTLDMDTGGTTIKGILVMTFTTVDTEEDAATVGGFSTLDECDAAGYSRQTFTTQSVQTDNANDRGEYHADDLDWTLTTNGTRDYQGVLMVRHVDGGNGDVPICFMEFAANIPKEVNRVIASKPTEGYYHVS